jgi:hypothetical protein
MRTLFNDLESLMLIHRLSLELQCSTNSILSCGNVAVHLPISIHPFERQLIKETSVTIDEVVSKSETATVEFLNSTIGDGIFAASTDGFLYTVDYRLSLNNGRYYMGD